MLIPIILFGDAAVGEYGALLPPVPNGEMIATGCLSVRVLCQLREQKKAGKMPASIKRGL